PTAWLDGLRGCAAFCVCMSHLVGYSHGNVGLCYGHKILPGVYYTSPTSLPLIRLLFSGQFFSIILFFFISGYVLTKRLLSLLHQGQRDEFLESLNSAVCRRPGRLLLPVVWMTLSLVFVWHLTGITTPYPPRQPGLFSELIAWVRETLKFMDPFREGILYTSYNYHTWTIPVELRGSMLIYIWLFASSQLTARVRVLLTLTMVLYGVLAVMGVWYTAFLAGLLTAELDLIYADDSVPNSRLPWDGIVYALRLRPRLRKVLMHMLLFAGLYLAGQPFTPWHSREVLVDSCKGWRTLNWLIPAVYSDEGVEKTSPAAWRWYWLFWASWFTLVGTKEIPWFRKLFETRPAQYLGKHSFALYLLHGPTIAIVSERLLYLTGAKSAIDAEQVVQFGYLENKLLDLKWWPFTNVGPDGLELNFLFCLVISMITFLYIAELGTKSLDVPSIRVSRWGYNKL
ncbi:acyltransferase 3, partial [Tricladium varicosporioides]